MAGKATTSNPLVVSARPDTSLNVQLHPLVLLTISDNITRHVARQQGGLVIGAIIGQQNGRSFTLEHAFECKQADPASGTILDSTWFSERLDMYKEVHKDPALDLVALYALGPAQGPQPTHLPVLRQVQDITSSDSIMLLLFHPELVDDLQGGKLPISLYEAVQETDGDQSQARFKELAFEVETGDAEMIGVNFVAAGGGNATAVPKADIASTAAGAASSKDKKTKGKGRAKDRDSEDVEPGGTATTNALSPEDDELISTLNSKVNAIKMLNERLGLIRSYLQTLPPSYLTDPTSAAAPPEATNYTLLRSITSMLSRLPLLAPPVPSSTTGGADPASVDLSSLASPLQQAGEKEKQDVHLTALLASLTRSIAEAQSLGPKFHVLQRERANKERNPFSRGGRMGAGGGGGVDLGGDDGFPADNGGF